MSFTERNSTMKPAREIARDVIARRWYTTSQGIRRILASLRDSRLRQFDGEPAGEAEIRVAVAERTERAEPPAELVSVPHPGAESPGEGEDEELLWKLRRLLASSGGTIADVTHALERRGEEIDRTGCELLADEVRAVEVDIAILRTLLSDPVDWDRECGRLLAGEIPPFEDHVADEEHEDEGV